VRKIVDGQRPALGHEAQQPLRANPEPQFEKKRPGSDDRKHEKGNAFELADQNSGAEQKYRVLRDQDEIQGEQHRHHDGGDKILHSAPGDKSMSLSRPTTTPLAVGAARSAIRMPASYASRVTASCLMLSSSPRPPRSTSCRAPTPCIRTLWIGTLATS
jgi:hypothetical protein